MVGVLIIKTNISWYKSLKKIILVILLRCELLLLPRECLEPVLSKTVGLNLESWFMERRYLVTTLQIDTRKLYHNQLVHILEKVGLSLFTLIFTDTKSKKQFHNEKEMEKSDSVELVYI